MPALPKETPLRPTAQGSRPSPTLPKGGSFPTDPAKSSSPPSMPSRDKDTSNAEAHQASLPTITVDAPLSHVAPQHTNAPHTNVPGDGAIQPGLPKTTLSHGQFPQEAPQSRAPATQTFIQKATSRALVSLPMSLPNLSLATSVSSKETSPNRPSRTVSLPIVTSNTHSVDILSSFQSSTAHPLHLHVSANTPVLQGLHSSPTESPVINTPTSEQPSASTLSSSVPVPPTLIDIASKSNAASHSLLIPIRTSNLLVLPLSTDVPTGTNVPSHGLSIPLRVSANLPSILQVLPTVASPQITSAKNSKGKGTSPLSTVHTSLDRTAASEHDHATKTRSGSVSSTVTQIESRTPSFPTPTSALVPIDTVAHSSITRARTTIASSIPASETNQLLSPPCASSHGLGLKGLLGTLLSGAVPLNCGDQHSTSSSPVASRASTQRLRTTISNQRSETDSSPEQTGHSHSSSDRPVATQPSAQEQRTTNSDRPSETHSSPKQTGHSHSDPSKPVVTQSSVEQQRTTSSHQPSETRSSPLEQSTHPQQPSKQQTTKPPPEVQRPTTTVQHDSDRPPQTQKAPPAKPSDKGQQALQPSHTQGSENEHRQSATASVQTPSPNSINLSPSTTILRDSASNSATSSRRVGGHVNLIPSGTATTSLISYSTESTHISTDMSAPVSANTMEPSPSCTSHSCEGSGPNPTKGPGGGGPEPGGVGGNGSLPSNPNSGTAAIIGGSVAGVVAVIVIIVVVAGFFICRRRDRRKLKKFQQPGMAPGGYRGITYIPVIPVGAASAYQPASPLISQNAEQALTGSRMLKSQYSYQANATQPIIAPKEISYPDANPGYENSLKSESKTNTLYEWVNDGNSQTEILDKHPTAAPRIDSMVSTNTSNVQFGFAM